MLGFRNIVSVSEELKSKVLNNKVIKSLIDDYISNENMDIDDFFTMIEERFNDIDLDSYEVFQYMTDAELDACILGNIVGIVVDGTYDKRLLNIIANGDRLFESYENRAWRYRNKIEEGKIQLTHIFYAICKHLGYTLGYDDLLNLENATTFVEYGTSTTTLNLDKDVKIDVSTTSNGKKFISAIKIFDDGEWSILDGDMDYIIPNLMLNKNVEKIYKDFVKTL